ncbi:dTDP-L-rhamnose 4-epimerase [Methylobacterium crusticola]|uniref:dTDP-L-rhamnose 4-epimerase n=1 Tax=Methylobacterium crusticola TaxID=1697972 RepID=A0ABQ4QWY3_9HYPH|nr:NAD-dependent epimerase/dehydratase family protein [Methylobacterium crusticola]GJD49724.1 dTDP-L-rhamnose 4-epimerase [Methylobacterium crusticola]
MRTGTLITGGAGFIGCELSRRLSPDDGPVVAVDSLLPQVHPARTRPDALPEHVELIVADVRDRRFWDAFFAACRPRQIVHLAAETGTGQSLTQSARHSSVNVTGTAEMLDAMSRVGHRPDHVLLASSRAVYGEGAWRGSDGAVFYPGRRSHRRLAAGRWSFDGPDGAPAAPLPHEAASVHPHPSSIYGATKLAQEHLLATWASARSVPLSILRFQNVYGPGQSPFNPHTGIVTLFHQQAHAGEAIEVYEDGQIGRDFVFIDDAVAACRAALAAPPTALRTLDVGSGTATTILDAARIIAGAHGAPDPRISGRFRDADIRWAVSDAAPAADQLGIRATIGFAEGSRRVSEWLLRRGLP